MLYGNDVSHWNSLEDLNKQNCDFLMIKLTEGKTLKDKKAGLFTSYAMCYEIPYGYYHFARAERNTPSDEANNFLRNLYTKDNVLLALDVEQKSLERSDIDIWALEWLKIVEHETGIKPLLYCSQSQVKRFKKVQKNNNGLWVARYSNKLGNISPWKIYAIWQYDSNGIDKNKFNGNINQLKAYGRSKYETKTHETKKRQESVHADSKQC